MNKPLVVFVDVDGVVADLGTEWVRRYNADYGDTLCYHTGITGWDMSAAVKPECGKKIFDYLHAADLYDHVAPIEGALLGVETLRARGCRIVFATSTNVHQAGNKLRWLERHGFLTLKHGTISPDYVELHDKHLLRGSALIDDGPHNLAGFAGRRILFHATHNATHQDATFERLSTWGAVVEALAPAGAQCFHAANEGGCQFCSTPVALNKGAFGGPCNRSACLRPGADWYNHATRAYYCQECAGLINYPGGRAEAIRLFGHDICTQGQHTPSV